MKRAPTTPYVRGKERGLYVGDHTAAAATARAGNLRRRIEGKGPLAYIAAVIATITGRLEGPAQSERNAKFSRGLLAGLELDPDAHMVARRRWPQVGLVIRDHTGHAVRFLSEKKLTELMEDEAFVQRFTEASA